MAFADPQSVTTSLGAQTLNRVKQGESSTTFQSTEGAFTLDISHNYGKRNRHLAKLTWKQVTADPYRPDIYVPTSTSIQLIVDAPVDGFSSTQLADVADGLLDYLSASTNANLIKLITGQL
jgi:hypothetical protein